MLFLFQLNDIGMGSGRGVEWVSEDKSSIFFIALQ